MNVRAGTYDHPCLFSNGIQQSELSAVRKLNVKSDKERIELDVKLSSLCGWGLSACECMDIEFLPSGRPVLLARESRRSFLSVGKSC